LAAGPASAAPPPEFFDYGAISTCSDSECQAYFSTTDVSIPKGFDQGFSWYSQAWPLVSQPIDNLQIGLSSTWINPDNVSQSAKVQKAFCAASNIASFRRDSWYGYFQTIEGGLGWWRSTHFPTLMPKYALNGTPDCYNTEFATPGWTFDSARPVARYESALVQLSNALLLPPDGITLNAESSGTYLGSAWMSLPLPLMGQRSAPTGSNHWTLFMNAANYSGPVAYWLPSSWSAVSAGNTLLTGLGLDSQPGFVGSFASEWNTVPYFSTTDSTGRTVTRMPTTQFPIDDQGRTIFTRDAMSYSPESFANSISSWLKGASRIPTRFASGGSADLPLRVEPADFFQNGRRLAGLLDSVSLASFDNGAAYGFQWKNASGTGQLPTTFIRQGAELVAAKPEQVPADLARAAFPSRAPEAFMYRSPSWWKSSKPASSVRAVRLVDGSTVRYRWYRFVDQPALLRLALTAKEATRLQSIVTSMHRAWPNGTRFMDAPRAGALAGVDSALVVTPPKGMEYGYVPYVVSQGKS
jgi:hypothetical protein